MTKIRYINNFFFLKFTKNLFEECDPSHPVQVLTKIESLNIETPFNRELMRKHFTDIIIENMDAE